MSDRLPVALLVVILVLAGAMPPGAIAAEVDPSGTTATPDVDAVEDSSRDVRVPTGRLASTTSDSPRGLLDGPVGPTGSGPDRHQNARESGSILRSGAMATPSDRPDIAVRRRTARETALQGPQGRWPVRSATAIGDTTVGVEGPSFTVPASLEDEVEDARDTITGDLAPNAFVVATEDALYLVFTDRDPEKGLATVTGTEVGSVSADGLTFTVLAAGSVSFETTGTRTTIDAVSSNPDRFRHDLVRITATHRRVTSLTDPDEQSDLTLASSSGVLVEDPLTPADVPADPARNARALSVNSSTTELGSSAESEVDRLLGDRAQLNTFDFEMGFWTDAESTVDAVVLTPDSAARDFVATYDEAGIVRSRTSKPLLYVVSEERSPTQYNSVRTLKEDARDGDVVTVQSNLFGATVSVQETLEESTGCNDQLLRVETPSGPACIDVNQDNLVHAGAAWSDPPTSRDDLLFVVGVSSRHMDKRSEELRGEYRLTGEVVSTERVDPSLPEGRILVVYDLDRVGSIDFDRLDDDTRDRIKSRFETLNASVAAGLLDANTSFGSLTGAVTDGSSDANAIAGAHVWVESFELTGSDVQVVIERRNDTHATVGVFEDEAPDDLEVVNPDGPSSDNQVEAHYVSFEALRGYGFEDFSTDTRTTYDLVPPSTPSGDGFTLSTTSRETEPRLGTYVLSRVPAGETTNRYVIKAESPGQPFTSQGVGSTRAGRTGEVDVEITDAVPATVRTSNVTPESATVEQGDRLTVTAEVTNDGSVASTATVDLELGGTVLATETTEVLSGGETVTVSFTVSSSTTAGLDPGDYTFAVVTSDDRVEGDLTVEEGSTGGPSVPAAVAGDDCTVSTTDLQDAIRYWAAGETVPGTTETVDTATLQTIIRHWAAGTDVPGCSSADVAR